MAKPTSSKSPTKSPAVDAYGEVPEGASEAPAFERRTRVYRNQQELDHDLFKLKPSKFRRNMGYSDESILLVDIEHSHHFHTIDSSGKKQDACTPIGGHFHYVKVVGADDGKEPVLEISKPMKWILKAVPGKKKLQRVAVPLTCPNHEGAIVDDEHTHDYEYLGSEKIKLRKPNLEAAKFQTAQAQLHQPKIDGVREA